MMPIVERSVIVPLGLEEAWEAFFGNEMQNWCELSDIVVEVRDFQWREDGTPTYVMVNGMGPLTSTCPSRTSLARIANKWTAMIVIVLANGRRRFTEIRRQVDGISGKVLTDTLRDLKRDGLVVRHVFAEVPPRVEYELTELGHTLHAPLEAVSR